jgi:hypothetical protein
LDLRATAAKWGPAKASFGLVRIERANLQAKVNSFFNPPPAKSALPAHLKGLERTTAAFKAQTAIAALTH